MTIEGIEVTQAVQDMNHSVALIAGRRTVIRVYFSVTTDQGFGQISGRLLVKSAGHDVIVDPSIQSISVLDQWNGNMDSFKRVNVDTSLNFELPDFLTVEGSCTISVLQVMDMYRNRATVPCTNADTLTRTVSFTAGAPHRLTIIGLQYTQNSTSHAPRQIDLDLIRSWFLRAYPITSLVYSTRTVAANFTVTGTAASTANTQIAQIRALDISGGVDKRTHYYGLVFDGASVTPATGTFMRGLSHTPAGAADPSAVGSGPTGSGTFGWDNDGSYGDWYTGHEQGHTLGRRHVGGTCGEPGTLDPNFPFPSGQLSGPTDGFVGFDVGDAAMNIRMQAMDGTVWHDVMGYCANQWVSSYTYEALMDRIGAEDKLPSAGREIPEPNRLIKNDLLVVIGLWNHDADAITVTSVDRVRQAWVGEPSAALTAVGLGARGEELVVGPVVVHPPSEDAPAAPALVTAVLPVSSQLSRIEFRDGQRVIGSYERVSGFDAVAGARVERRAGTDQLEWHADVGSAPQVHYHVQASFDGGGTWTTWAVGQRTESIDLQRIRTESGGNPFKVRVTTTDGFDANEEVFDID
ncbi:hypothetical protein ACTOB_004976 [Actinoplanes oblitus]|uniref:Fibronectin type-III domain-containing protein n=1 Tax=Actinoplanes oblitus TaxID=3040509 RepID=A0ABY8W598_9ACTN|nr:hypothetical protein [Actinoplanes oblitus]WIM93011.1 hypothetical protein ACTOB_004976 [Actinoplanes oblitus]